MITRLDVENLRAYGRLSLELEEGVNFLVGPNAVGKTSLLEAISMALVGEPQTVDDLKLLMREQVRPSRVKVAFVQGEVAYEAERNLRPEGKRGHCYLREGSGTRRRLRWDELTETLEGIFGTSAAFFKRIIYMGEGDISRFVTQPPGPAVMSQIDSLLGIDQLDESKQAVRDALKYARDKIERCGDLLNSYQDRVHELAAGREGCEEEEPLAIIECLDARMGDLEEMSEAVGRRKARLTRAIEELKEFEADILEVSRLLGEDPAAVVFEKSLGDWLSTRLSLATARVDDLGRSVGSLQEAIGRLRGRRETHEDVRRMLERPDVSAGDMRPVPCPVCGKPLTPEERTDILSATSEELDAIVGEQAELDAKLVVETEELATARARLRKLEECARRLEEWAVRYPNVKSASSASKEAETLERELVIIGEEATESRADLRALREAYSAVSSLRVQMESLGFASMTGVRQGLVRLTRAEMLLEASDRAIDRAVAEQRGQNLDDVYRQIADAWQSFVQYSDWQVQFGPEGEPSVLDVGQGREFDLTQLSGGEKTALLAIIHSVLASRFSEARFMMIDEPLEHLDVVNRRSLVRFFVEALRNGFFEQMLVTTFEESLVRKYLTEPGVNVIYLDAYRPKLRLLSQETA